MRVQARTAVPVYRDTVLMRYRPPASWTFDGLGGCLDIAVHASHARTRLAFSPRSNAIRRRRLRCDFRARRWGCVAAAAAGARCCEPWSLDQTRTGKARRKAPPRRGRSRFRVARARSRSGHVLRPRRARVGHARGRRRAHGQRTMDAG